MGWTKAGGREQLLSCIQGWLLMAHFIALLSLLCGSLQVNELLCLIMSQLLHDLSAERKNALCEGTQGSQGKTYPKLLCAVVSCYGCLSALQIKRQNTNNLGCCRGNSHLRVWRLTVFSFLSFVFWTHFPICQILNLPKSFPPVWWFVLHQFLFL